ncbi:hypothetical protein ARMGADRAFT_818828 [Armillaria gallica]|uniref:Uncharacterized protein n=1 Tax=Armillaria gallica TaxID=47427 RepID=A0A2H3CXU7_ARMGA|nr:hypothetical protein ARMGADRAFT_818828 [Armillaria gallica]
MYTRSKVPRLSVLSLNGLKTCVTRKNIKTSNRKKSLSVYSSTRIICVGTIFFAVAFALGCSDHRGIDVARQRSCRGRNGLMSKIY